ncbi:hypothetical protein NQ156_01120 [Microbacterium sp. zg.Y625]|uniref:hypothetical protein n=1 Tax=Microbacterium jiangjiandongii TaxID=3049071 RepID=UPI00214C50A8|nr:MULTISPECIES: hypothetical protein [unclassified Microbacterium]MCR2791660.1 hypothetical protein [Microbacterium sp. zg.Y625]WIM24479.1 hypothetical protein QNO14_10030 [Microbacterium sp. zg-Y625]
MNDANPDLDALAGFLEHLDPRDAAAAAFARHLLDAGAVVRSLWGPVQMDVRGLSVQRGDMIVRFGVERGFSDGVLIGRADAADESGLRPIALAVFAWARANGIPLQLDDPDGIEVDLVTVGIPALDWVGAGNDDAVHRVHRAWFEHRRRLDRLQGRTRGRPSDVDLRAVIADGVAALEAAAPRAVPSRPTQDPAADPASSPRTV